MENDVTTLVAELNKDMPPKYMALSKAIASVVDEFNLVSYIPLNIKEDDSVSDLLSHIDMATAYGTFHCKINALTAMSLLTILHCHYR
jgi:hypothetical protein